jgi:uncharacterized repeat protein (TIGR03837 family)
MDAHPLRCDVFCRVVDNFGDAAVCWRLCRQMAVEYGWQVRLWIDQPMVLDLLVPSDEYRPLQVLPWSIDFTATDPADVVIEAFACELPASYVEMMAAQTRPPKWINLEYLSAEPWIDDCHGLSSHHPRLALQKSFYFPGFTAKSGGLLREPDYDERRTMFDAESFRREFGLPPVAESGLTISLFHYPHAPVSTLLNALAKTGRPIQVLAPGSISIPQHLSAVTIHALPFLPQRRYDELLWLCDLNFVRGEDSFVRAQWAGKPLVWNIYPQSEDAHITKLMAFLNLYRGTQSMQKFWLAWNEVPNALPLALAWTQLHSELSLVHKAANEWAASLKTQPDLVRQLVTFCLNPLK